MTYRSDVDAIEVMLDGLYEASRIIRDVFELTADMVSVSELRTLREEDAIRYRGVELTLGRFFECILSAVRIDQEYEDSSISEFKISVQKTLNVGNRDFSYIRTVRNTVCHSPSGLAPQTLFLSLKDPLLIALADRIGDAIEMVEQKRSEISEDNILCL